MAGLVAAILAAILTGVYGAQVPAYSLSGRVVAQGGALPAGLTVTAYAMVGEDLHGLPCRLTPDGQFSASDLVPGTYLIMATPGDEPLEPNQADERGHVLVTIRDADVTDVALSTARGVTVRGRVRFDGAAADMAQPAGIVARAPLAVAERVGPAISAIVNTDGTFAFHSLNGPRIVRADHVADSEGTTWWFSGVTLDGRDVTNEPIDFAGATAGELTVVFTARPSAIVGRVEDIAGLPVSGACVLLLPDNRDLRRGWSTALGTFVTDRRSRFYFVGIPPGEYLAAAYEWPTCPDRAQLAGTPDDLDGRTTRIDVRAGTTARVLVTATTLRPQP